MAHITERLGPIDYEVIEFPGGIVTGAGFRRIVELSDAARILVLDIKFLSKSADGHVVTTSAHDLGEIDGVDMGFFDGAASCLLEDGLTMRLLRTATHAAVASNVHNKVSRRPPRPPMT